MKNDELQLLIHHPNISEYTPEINYTGISIKKVTPSTNSKNYLFLDLKIDDTAKAGKFDITFTNENSEDLVHTYELKERVKPA